MSKRIRDGQAALHETIMDSVFIYWGQLQHRLRCAVRGHGARRPRCPLACAHPLRPSAGAGAGGTGHRARDRRRLGAARVATRVESLGKRGRHSAAIGTRLVAWAGARRRPGTADCNAPRWVRLQRQPRNRSDAHRRWRRIRRWRWLPCGPGADAEARLAHRSAVVAAQLQPTDARVGGANGTFVTLDDFYESVTFLELPAAGQPAAEPRHAVPVDLQKRR